MRRFELRRPFPKADQLIASQVAQIIGDAIGKRVKHHNLTLEDFRDHMTSVGVPKDYADRMAGWEYKISLNKEHRWNEVIEGLLGRKPIDLHTFAQNAKEVWM